MEELNEHIEFYRKIIARKEEIICELELYNLHSEDVEGLNGEIVFCNGIISALESLRPRIRTEVEELKIKLFDTMQEMTTNYSFALRDKIADLISSDNKLLEIEYLPSKDSVYTRIDSTECYNLADIIIPLVKEEVNNDWKRKAIMSLENRCQKKKRPFKRKSEVDELYINYGKACYEKSKYAPEYLDYDKETYAKYKTSCDTCRELIDRIRSLEGGKG